MEFSTMSMSELVTYYNTHNPEQPVKRFSDRKAAERRCSSIKIESPAPYVEQSNETSSMKVSLKLKREIRLVGIGTTWDNAHQMWKLHPDWMSPGQQDRLTLQLYSAAKQGIKKQVTINNRTFELVHVGEN